MAHGISNTEKMFRLSHGDGLASCHAMANALLWRQEIQIILFLHKLATRARLEYDGRRVLTLLIVIRTLREGEELGQTWRHPALKFGLVCLKGF